MLQPDAWALGVVLRDEFHPCSLQGCLNFPNSTSRAADLLRKLQTFDCIDTHVGELSELNLAKAQKRTCGLYLSRSYHSLWGLGLKVGDAFTVPLCTIHHDDVHRTTKERAWWHDRKIEPIAVAAELWRESRGKSLPPEDTEPAATASEAPGVASGEAFPEGDATP